MKFRNQVRKFGSRVAAGGALLVGSSVASAQVTLPTEFTDATTDLLTYIGLAQVVFIGLAAASAIMWYLVGLTKRARGAAK